MWFAFGFVTLLAGFAFSWYVRVHHRWKGETLRVDAQAVERRIGKSKSGQWVDRLGVRVPPGSAFKLRSEGAHDRFFKHLGIAAEIPLLNRDVDRTLYLECEDRAVARWIDGDAGLARTLVALCTYSGHGHEVAALERAEGRLWLDIDKRGDTSIEGATMALAPQLAAVAAALERIGPRSVEPDGFVRRAALLLSLNTAVAVAGLLLWVGTGLHYEMLEPGRFFVTTLPVSLGAVLLFAYAAFRLLGRTSRTHLVLIEIALVGTAGFLAFAYGLGRAANAHFDDAPAQVFMIEEFGTQEYACGKRKRSTCYQLDLPALPELRDDTSLTIDASLYHRLRGAPAIRLALKPGALGAPWIESITPVHDAH